LKAYWESEVYLQTFLTSALDWYALLKEKGYMLNKDTMFITLPNNNTKSTNSIMPTKIRTQIKMQHSLPHYLMGLWIS